MADSPSFDFLAESQEKMFKLQIFWEILLRKALLFGFLRAKTRRALMNQVFVAVYEGVTKIFSKIFQILAESQKAFQFLVGESPPHPPPDR